MVEAFRANVLPLGCSQGAKQVIQQRDHQDPHPPQCLVFGNTRIPLSVLGGGSRASSVQRTVVSPLKNAGVFGTLVLIEQVESSITAHFIGDAMIIQKISLPPGVSLSLASSAIEMSGSRHSSL